VLGLGRRSLVLVSEGSRSSKEPANAVHSASSSIVAVVVVVVLNPNPSTSPMYGCSLQGLASAGLRPPITT
jgi:hypothetical protein